MKVELISYSQTPKVAVPLELLDLVAYCARVSNPSNQMNKETNEKLINQSETQSDQSEVVSDKPPHY